MQRNNIKSVKIIERCFVPHHDKVMDISHSTLTRFTPPSIFFGVFRQKAHNMLNINDIYNLTYGGFRQNLHFRHKLKFILTLICENYE